MACKSKEKRRIRNHKYFEKWYKKNGRKNRPQSQNDIRNKWSKEHPIEIKAERILNKAVKEGSIIKLKNCEKCGRNVRLLGHHEDYSKPLEVIWVCTSCHKFIHNNVIP